MITFLDFILEDAAPKGVTVHGVHYSHQANLTHLDPAKSGTGIKGAEQKRLPDSEDDRIKHRAYFYNKTGEDFPKPEAGLGTHIHTAHLDKIYDPSKASDSEKAEVALHKQKHMGGWNHPSNAFESGVLDAGYRGYTNAGMTVVMGKDKVPVSYHGSR